MIDLYLKTHLFYRNARGYIFPFKAERGGSMYFLTGRFAFLKVNGQPIAEMLSGCNYIWISEQQQVYDPLAQSETYGTYVERLQLNTILESKHDEHKDDPQPGPLARLRQRVGRLAGAVGAALSHRR